MHLKPYHISAVLNGAKMCSALLTLVLLTHPAMAVQSGTLIETSTASILTVADDEPLPVPEPPAVEAGPEEPPSVQDVLLEVCEARGYGVDCAKALLGMMWKESRNVAGAIGDGGRARGYFQIHYRLHKVDLSCAQDLRCSAEWTLTYMERNGYPRYVRYAVQCHNGCNAGNGYAASALRHGERLWAQTMHTEPVAIAAK